MLAECRTILSFLVNFTVIESDMLIGRMLEKSKAREGIRITSLMLTETCLMPTDVFHSFIFILNRGLLTQY